MLTVVVLSIVVPSLVAAAGVALTGKLPNLVADARGIALQTVIIMVVLLAIAGGVAAVLLSRGSEASHGYRAPGHFPRSAADFTGDSICLAAGYSWNTNCQVVQLAGEQLSIGQRVSLWWKWRCCH